MSMHAVILDETPSWRADRPAFPRLAAAVRMGRALHARGQRLRAGWLTAAATARSWRAPGTPSERATQAAEIAARLLALDGVEVDRVGVVPARPAIVVAGTDEPALLRAILAGTPAFVLSAAPVLPAWLAPRLGNHVVTDDDVAATRHALAALRAGLPVVTTRALAARLDLLTVARMVRVPIVPVIARRRGPRPPEVRVVVCPPLYPLAGEAHAGALARALDVTATSRPADSW
ncbi:MAG: hypothetical protein IPH44_35815 [Myxococcales bacterium]|nr:hypothetical protein [Myxococcales bacterium]MBK7191157.1 hypothetical protein [Myxococcales bacterium]MBP6844367.1 hypothetical protein [Kofleriaceae bacterium]